MRTHDPDDDRDTLTDVPGGVRLQKVLAEAGIGSRRHCEELIGAGRVEVAGDDLVSRRGEVPRHRQSHRPEPDEGDPGHSRKLRANAYRMPSCVTAPQQGPDGEPELRSPRRQEQEGGTEAERQELLGEHHEPGELLIPER